MATIQKYKILILKNTRRRRSKTRSTCGWRRRGRSRVGQDDRPKHSINQGYHKWQSNSSNSSNDDNNNSSNNKIEGIMPSWLNWTHSSRINIGLRYSEVAYSNVHYETSPLNRCDCSFVFAFKKHTHTNTQTFFCYTLFRYITYLKVRNRQNSSDSHMNNEYFCMIIMIF